ncbi:hypothetical protein [Alteromonas antoniana]|uniref:hypothetical protein n=1 Tax=Alteromonas antoniana TaxID=2803813 RepID=UPI001C445E0A|nr:hypothetical protein [Alteromonas antoniana]
MKYLIMLTALLLAGCVGGPFARIGMERAAKIQTGQSASFCNQLKMQCKAQPGQTAGSGGYFREWENADGSVGCSCDMK